MTFLLRSSLPLTNLGFICSFARHCRQNNACLLFSWFGAVWMKYALQELDIYFLVAITSSLYLSAWIRVTSGLPSGDMLLIIKIGTSGCMNKALCSCFSFRKGEKKYCCYINFLSRLVWLKIKWCLFLLRKALLHCALCKSLSQISVLGAVLSKSDSCFRVGLIF